MLSVRAAADGLEARVDERRWPRPSWVLGELSGQASLAALLFRGLQHRQDWKIAWVPGYESPGAENTS